MTDNLNEKIKILLQMQIGMHGLSDEEFRLRSIAIFTRIGGILVDLAIALREVKDE